MFLGQGFVVVICEIALSSVQESSGNADEHLSEKVGVLLHLDRKLFPGQSGKNQKVDCSSYGDAHDCHAQLLSHLVHAEGSNLNRAFSNQDIDTRKRSKRCAHIDQWVAKLLLHIRHEAEATANEEDQNYCVANSHQVILGEEDGKSHAAERQEGSVQERDKRNDGRFVHTPQGSCRVKVHDGGGDLMLAVLSAAK